MEKLRCPRMIKMAAFGGIPSAEEESFTPWGKKHIYDKLVKQHGKGNIDDLDVHDKAMEYGIKHKTPENIDIYEKSKRKWVKTDKLPGIKNKLKRIMGLGGYNGRYE